MPKSKVRVRSNFLKHPQLIKTTVKKRSLKKNKIKLPLIPIFLVILIIFLFIIIFFIVGFLNVKNYNINGNQQVNSQDISNIIKKYSLGKLILSVEPGSIENELLKQFPLLSYVRVTKNLPSTLNVDVKERSYALVIKTIDDAMLVSTDGVVVQKLDTSVLTSNTYNDINIVTLSDETGKSIGYKFDTKFINQILLLIQSLSNNKLQFDAIVIDKSKNVNISVLGTTILISLIDGNTDISQVISNVNVIYKKLSQSKKIQRIDARLGDKIAVS